MAYLNQLFSFNAYSICMYTMVMINKDDDDNEKCYYMKETISMVLCRLTPERRMTPKSVRQTLMT